MQTLDKFIIRMPPGMRDAIKAAAERNRRSMNAEILVRLEDIVADEFLRGIETEGQNNG